MKRRAGGSGGHDFSHSKSGGSLDRHKPGYLHFNKLHRVSKQKSGLLRGIGLKLCDNSPAVSAAFTDPCVGGRLADWHRQGFFMRFFVAFHCLFLSFMYFTP
jgi:hypothetical protein